MSSLLNSRGRALLAAVVVVAALATGVGFAAAMNSVRLLPVADQVQSASPSASAATAASTATVASSPTDLPTPTASPSPTPSPPPLPTPSATPVPTPVPTPAVPSEIPWPTPPPGINAEEACVDYQFTAGPITVASLSELQEGVLGTWSGCVTTPWVPRYWVTLTFRADGTYSSDAWKGSDEPALYYGSDEDSPEKVYELDNLYDDLEGIGQIDIYFWPGNVNRGELRNIALMGDKLSFEFFHRGQYGPLTYELWRRDSGD